MTGGPRRKNKHRHQEADQSVIRAGRVMKSGANQQYLRKSNDKRTAQLKQCVLIGQEGATGEEGVSEVRRRVKTNDQATGGVSGSRDDAKERRSERNQTRHTKS